MFCCHWHSATYRYSARSDKKRANIIIMASHDPSILERLCNKAIWVDHGRIVQAGSVEDVLRDYHAATV